MERHGEDFFAAARRDAMLCLHEDDRAYFVSVFNKENVVNTVDSDGQFKLTYRLMMDGKPVYVGMKAVRMPDSRTHMLVAVTNVDAQMRQNRYDEHEPQRKDLFRKLFDIAAVSGLLQRKGIARKKHE